MCEFCVKHGEGKKWYLQAKNYSYDLLSDIERRKFITTSYHWVEDLYRNKFKYLKFLPFKTPFIGSVLRGAVKLIYMNKHWGQVIPIEDVEKILSFTNSITRIPCVCRKTITGKECRVCFLISMNPEKIGIADIVDQSFFGGPDVARFEKVQKKWTLDFIRDSEKDRMMHTIWTFKTPFIGALCNCDIAAGCIAMKIIKEATPVLFRAEYVASYDKDSCHGCGKCIRMCQFNAIIFDKSEKKIKIDQKKCYGCGICRSACEKKAISLKDRHAVSEVAKLW